ncbi:hypothetical protein EV192_102635 [Actinocrispum wychmicini]|uniref:Uncharacterized protein n=1 Tax=Actinocrispum wychmicini TaxID=1213861 RepID=A0A4R2JTM1_9PSEU|nr:hypothetical protein EV192_102635 [Actinocrispum wychmicini]
MTPEALTSTTTTLGAPDLGAHTDWWPYYFADA